MRLASKASTRNRFVLIINVKVVILRLRFGQSGQSTGAAPCAGIVPDARFGVSSLYDNNLARFGEELGWAKRLTDLGRLTGLGLHFDRIAACFLKRLRSIATACGDAILKTASRMFTLRNGSLKR